MLAWSDHTIKEGAIVVSHGTTSKLVHRTDIFHKNREISVLTMKKKQQG
jgi:hypothetical protein